MGILIRDIRRQEWSQLGQLIIDVYSRLDGFPTIDEQPDYYRMLADIGQLTCQPETRILVAVDEQDPTKLLGGVVYFGDMADYGSGGTATSVENASGIRLLAVDREARGLGVGKALTEKCLNVARESGHAQVVLHTTQAMKVAWGMYERLGFARSEDLDFDQQGLAVYGFRLRL
ncbi:MAG: N-acetyltransferase [Lysobacteraceae bacterium]|nr:MAG: N-acetyltransferase [Xanthomonadaceae bacterium]